MLCDALCYYDIQQEIPATKPSVWAKCDHKDTTAKNLDVHTKMVARVGDRCQGVAMKVYHVPIDLHFVQCRLNS